MKTNPKSNLNMVAGKTLSDKLKSVRGFTSGGFGLSKRVNDLVSSRTFMVGRKYLGGNKSC